ncbi:MAG: OsmC family protein [Calditrichaeota bacterium]|nr:OsmC family protein [Calditrichota bacterium]
MNVEIKQVDGLTLVGKADSGHWVAMDGGEKVGGNDAGTRPMELLLMSLGGCTGMDVISILQKKRTPFTKVNMRLEAERADEHPKVFTKIKITFLVYGDKDKIKAADVERAIELSSTKYCSASSMLKKTAEISYQYEVIDTK